MNNTNNINNIKNTYEYREEIKKDILGITYQETITYFNKFKDCNTKYYFRPIQIDNNVFWLDKDKDILRCNVIVKNNLIHKIVGWY